MDITSVHQVMDLLTQFFPKEDRTVESLVNNNNHKHQENQKEAKGDDPLYLPLIHKRGEELVRSNTMTSQDPPSSSHLTSHFTTVSVGTQVELSLKEHTIPKPSFISKLNQEAYCKTLPTPILEMRQTLEDSSYLVNLSRNSDSPQPGILPKRNTSTLGNHVMRLS